MQNDATVDEISYRRHHRYWTSVADHNSGAIVWCRPGRNSATLQAFFDRLGERKDSIRAVAIDISASTGARSATPSPTPRSAFTRSTSAGSRRARPTRSGATNETPTSARSPRPDAGSRHALVAPEGPGTPDRRLATLDEVQSENRRLYRALPLREELRLLYHLDDPR